MILGEEVETLEEAIRLLKAAGAAAVRLGKVMKLRHELREAERDGRRS